MYLLCVTCFPYKSPCTASVVPSPLFSHTLSPWTVSQAVISHMFMGRRRRCCMGRDRLGISANKSITEQARTIVEC